jgi:hypothetical protein
VQLGPEFHAVYTAILAEDELSAQKVTADKALALKLLTQRYSKYDLPLPKLADLSAAVLNARVLRCRITGGLLYYQHKKHGMLLCIPDVYGSDGVNHRRSIFNEFHATPHSGHRGGTSTYNAIKVRFFWRDLHKDVLALNKACHECNVSKISRKAPQGLLQPVEVPLQIAQSYNIDRIGPFPESKNGNHMLMIAVDRFSRWVWLEALKVSCTSEQFADLFVNRVVLSGGRGIPQSIV